ITAQADYWRADGGRFLKDLPRQDVFLAEAGLFVASLKSSLFVQVNRRDFKSADAADDLTYQAGIAYWPRGDKYNLKLAMGRVEKTGAPARLQVVAQLQMFIW
ncbi:MAG TPA: hypothetical protein VFQ51_08225, partial [Vicinamibacteria bacterium]|nr:hypothetical protein [Vicinamibacteria bacterium]